MTEWNPFISVPKFDNSVNRRRGQPQGHPFYTTRHAGPQ